MGYLFQGYSRPSLGLFVITLSLLSGFGAVAAPPTGEPNFEPITVDSEGIPMELPVMVRHRQMRILENSSAPDQPQEDVQIMTANGHLVLRADPDQRRGGSRYVFGELQETSKRRATEVARLSKSAIRHYLSCKGGILGAPVMVELEDGLYAFAWDQGLVVDYSTETVEYYVKLHTLEIDPDAKPGDTYSLQVRTIEIPIKHWEDRLLPVPSPETIRAGGVNTPLYVQLPQGRPLRVAALTSVNFPLGLDTSDPVKLMMSVRTWAANVGELDGNHEQVAVHEIPMFLMRLSTVTRAKAIDAAADANWSLSASGEMKFRTEIATVHKADTEIQFSELSDLMDSASYRIVQPTPVAPCRALITYEGNLKKKG